MAWHKIPSEQTPKPIPPTYLKWFLAIILSLLFLVSFLYSNSHNELSIQQKWITTLIALSPLILTLCSFLSTIFIYLKKKTQHDFLAHEKAYADSQWEQWGARSISVLESVILLPKKITIAYMLNHQSQHEASYRIPQDIDYFTNGNSPCFILLKIIQNKVYQLSAQHRLKIKYLTKKNSNIGKSELTNAWESLFPNQILPELTIVPSLDYDYLENAIKNNENTIELILVEQQYTNKQSAALAAFIITQDDISHRYHLEKIANIKRPMPIEFDENYQDAITLFTEIQTQSITATHLFSDGKCHPDLLSALFQSSSKMTKISPNTQLDLEFFIGPTGDYSPWLNMALAVQFVSQEHKTALVLSQEPHARFIGTITSSQSI